MVMLKVILSILSLIKKYHDDVLTPSNRLFIGPPVGRGGGWQQQRGHQWQQWYDWQQCSASSSQWTSRRSRAAAAAKEKGGLGPGGGEKESTTFPKRGWASSKISWTRKEGETERRCFQQWLGHWVMWWTKIWISWRKQCCSLLIYFQKFNIPILQTQDVWRGALWAPGSHPSKHPWRKVTKVTPPVKQVDDQCSCCAGGCLLGEKEVLGKLQAVAVWRFSWPRFSLYSNGLFQSV